MIQTIWKFRVNPGITSYNMYKDCKILSIKNQGGVAAMWILLDKEKETESRHMGVFATGEELPDAVKDWEYIDTFFIGGGQVYHAFLKPKPS